MDESAFGLVSVVIPVYNAAEHFEETIQSILGQTYRNVEIIAVDDGSSDDSVELIRSYGDRVVLIEQENKGPAAARNAGAEAAKGEWIAFLDADDIWMPEKLQRQLSQMQGAKWSYTDSVFMGGVNDGKRDSQLNHKLSGDIFEQLVCGNFIGTSSVVVQRSVFNELKGFDRTLRSIQDWDLWVRIASKFPVAYLDEAVVKYRVHASSTSRSTRKTLPNHIKVIEKIFADDGVGHDRQQLKPVALARSLGICSQIAEEEGDYSFAFQCSLGAFLQQPSKTERGVRLLKSVVKLGLYWVGMYKHK